MSKIRFIVFSSPRSGSTALREALHKHDGVTCCGEIFGRNRILGLPRHLLGANGNDLLDERNADPAAFAARVLSAGRDPAVGFKLLPSQLVSFENAGLFRLILEDTSIRVIFLWRRDLVRRYLSERKFLETAGRPDTEEPQDLMIAESDVLTDCRRYDDLRKVMKSLLSRKHFVEVFYEDLAANAPDPFQTISGLLELANTFAGLEPQKTEPGTRRDVHVINEAEILEKCRYLV